MENNKQKNKNSYLKSFLRVVTVMTAIGGISLLTVGCAHQSNQAKPRNTQQTIQHTNNSNSSKNKNNKSNNKSKQNLNNMGAGCL